MAMTAKSQQPRLSPHLPKQRVVKVAAAIVADLGSHRLGNLAAADSQHNLRQGKTRQGGLGVDHSVQVVNVRLVVAGNEQQTVTEHKFKFISIKGLGKQ